MRIRAAFAAFVQPALCEHALPLHALCEYVLPLMRCVYTIAESARFVRIRAAFACFLLSCPAQGTKCTSTARCGGACLDRANRREALRPRLNTSYSSAATQCLKASLWKPPPVSSSCTGCRMCPAHSTHSVFAPSCSLHAQCVCTLVFMLMHS